jgi:predicted phage terminase large subunit-like protein
VWWRVAGAMFLIDQLRGRFDHAATANAIALLSVRHPEANAHYLEAAASAPEVIANLRKPVAGYTVSDEMAARLGMTPPEREQVAGLRRAGMANLQSSPVRGDKSVRARSHIAPEAEAGNVRLPANAPWLAALLDELTAFPQGSHDDQVDAMSLGLSKLGRGQASVAGASGPIGQPAPQPQRRRRGGSASVIAPGRLR